MKRCLKYRFFVVAVVTILGLASSIFALANDQEYVATAWRVAEPIKIDGDLSEWNTTAPIFLGSPQQLNKSPSYWEGPEDNSGNFYVMWDEDNLYIGAEIIDDVPFVRFMGYGLDGNDGLALYISTDPDADPDRVLYDSADFRVLFAMDNDMFDTGIDRDNVLIKQGIQTRGTGGYEAVLSGYEVALDLTEIGYNVEMKIPFSNFANSQIPLFAPSVGDRISFGLEMYDLDQACPGSEASGLTWKPGQPILSPGNWGTLVFEAE